MFNVGGMELLVIAMVALVVLGPDKLPGAIRQIGQVTGELRRISKGFQTDLRGALEESERQAATESERERAANEAAPDPATPDPGAARAAAQAELEAAEQARADEDRSASGDAGGSEPSRMNPPSTADAPEPGADALGDGRSSSAS